MQRVELDYGTTTMPIDLPDDAVVLTPDPSFEPPGLPDPMAATVAALRAPQGSAPLAELVGPGSTVTIAFPDRVKGGTQPTAHRKCVIPAAIAELDRAGVRREDITLVCAIGLHRKNRREEWADYLGEEVLSLVAPEQIVNHDAEDEDMIVTLPDSELGDVVQVSRHVIDSDLSIMISHTSGNPYGGFSGGAKMPATGLTTWRSIRGHHSPGTLGRPDFAPPSTGSRFRDQLAAIVRRIEEHTPQPLFTVDAVLNSASEQVAVAAGRIPDVEAATWPAARRRVEHPVPGEPADVLIIGIPRDFHYGKGMGTNPLLMMQSVGASFVRARGALVDQPVIIAAALCDGWFNPAEFPSYERTYDLLQTVDAPADLVRFEEELATQPDFVAAYRDRYAYHPFHAFSMAYLGGLARAGASTVHLVGAERPEYARGVGAVPADSVDDALAATARQLGRQPRILVVPQLSRAAYHPVLDGA